MITKERIISVLQSCVRVEELKRLYRDLARQCHPDLGGDLELMKLVNGLYHTCLERMHGQKSKDDSGKEHTYYYNRTREQALMDKIFELLALNMPGVDIVLMGSWIWILGETRPFKEKLGHKKGMVHDMTSGKMVETNLGLGCNWHSKRGCWYWHLPQGKTRYSGKSFGALAGHYGYQEFSKDKLTN